MADETTVHIPVKKVTGNEVAATSDVLAVEEPLEITLEFMDKGRRVQKGISVTMRTPGNDFDLATGFLFTEGIITSVHDIAAIRSSEGKVQNRVYVTLADSVHADVKRLERNFYTTSSCGVCGKASIEAVRTASTILDTKDAIRVAASVFYGLPATLQKQQEVFAQTGGLHACAIFELNGEIILSREDVGRHNALDKLVGAALGKGMLPLDNHLLLLSGRVSFELVQKAAMAGIKVITAVGAPSSLAVQMADEWGITLVGFLRGERFNIYSAPQRVVI